ncbi:MAG: glycosyltransferase family 4 protein [Acidimicrobiales bacterium]
MAEHLERRGWQVHVGSPAPVADTTLARLGMPSGLRQRRLPTWAFTPMSASYDLAVLVTNHLPPRSLAARSVLVVQFPMPAGRRHPLRARLAPSILAGYQIVVYSPFVARWVRSRWGRGACVLTPPVRLGAGCDEDHKQHLIAGVGRFFSGQHAKRHDLLIAAFSRLSVTAESWRLVLVGGIDDDDSSQAYLAGLRERAAGLNVEFVVSADEATVASTYKHAALFWHAAGFGRPDDEPERAEHFGIAAVEAMSWGAVPLVYDDGGISEIVTDDVGVRWRTVDELVAATKTLIDDPARRRALADMGVNQSRARYGPERFGLSLDRVLVDLS